MQNPPDITPDARTGKTPARAPKTPATPTLAKRVREILISLGGEAHRALVIEQLAKAMGHDTRQIPEELQAAVISSFEVNWRDERRRATYGFHLPFGEGSHRWGVRSEAAFA